MASEILPEKILPEKILPEEILHYNNSFISDFPGFKLFPGPGTEISSIVRKTIENMNDEDELTDDTLRKYMRYMSDGCSMWVREKLQNKDRNVIFVGLVEQNLIRKVDDKKKLDIIDEQKNDGLDLGLFERLKIIDEKKEMIRIPNELDLKDIKEEPIYGYYAGYAEFAGTYPSNCLIIKLKKTYQFIHCNTIDLGANLEKQNYFLKIQDGTKDEKPIFTLIDSLKEDKINSLLKIDGNSKLPDGGRPMSYVIFKDTDSNRYKVYCTFSGINIPHLVHIKENENKNENENDYKIKKMNDGNNEDYNELYKSLISLINEEIGNNIKEDIDIDMYLTCDSNDTRELFIKLITNDNDGFKFGNKVIKMRYNGSLPKACCANIDSVNDDTEGHEKLEKNSYNFNFFKDKTKSELKKNFFTDNDINSSYVSKDKFINTGDYAIAGSSNKEIIVAMSTELDNTMSISEQTEKGTKNNYTNSDHTPTIAVIQQTKEQTKEQTKGGKRRTRRRRRSTRRKRRMSRRRRRSTRRKR